MKKTILVVDDAGAPAKSMARHLLQQPQFTVRYLTAQPANAHALETAGAEIVAAYPGDTTALLARAAAIGSLFDLLRQHAPGQQSDLAASRSLYPGLQTFEQWAAQHHTWIDAVLA